MQDELEEALKTGAATRSLLRRAERRRATTPATIRALKDEVGCVQEEECIKQQIACSFYENLWGKRETCAMAQKELLKNIRRKLAPELRRIIDRPITGDEVANAIKLSKRRSSARYRRNPH